MKNANKFMKFHYSLYFKYSWFSKNWVIIISYTLMLQCENWKAIVKRKVLISSILTLFTDRCLRIPQSEAFHCYTHIT